MLFRWFRKETVSPSWRKRVEDVEDRLMKAERDLMECLMSQRDLRDKVLRKIQNKKDDDNNGNSKSLYGSGVLLPER